MSRWVTWALIFISFSVIAQDVQLSQFHIADLLSNPGLTGSQNRNRFMFHQRLQWPGLAGKYVTSFVSFDTYLHNYKSGIGTSLAVDEQGDGIYNTLQWNTYYSYELDINKEWAIRLGLQGGMYRKSLNDEGLIYSDQVTPDGIDHNNITERLGSIGFTQPDFGTGFVAYNERIWFGSSFYHINNPKQALLDGSEIFPKLFSLIAGYKIPLGSINPQSYTGFVKEFYLFPIIHYKMQGKSDQIEIGADLINHQLRLGVWYRGIPFKKYNPELHNNESVILLAGWKYNNLDFSYSYDIVFSKLQRAGTGGAHEIHLSYIFPRETKRKNYKKLPCPNFQKSTSEAPGSQYQ